MLVTIQGEALDHLFCHCVLPYSNWEWATRCISESFLSLVSGLQGALAQLGKSPEHLGTDNSSAATHELESIPGRPRGFNSDYLELCTHYDLTPLTINVGCPHEQGEVESFLAPFRIAWPDAQVEGHYVAKYCQDRGIDDTEEPLSPALPF